MLRIGSTLLAAALVISGLGCAVQAPVVPPLAAVFCDIQAPIDVDLDATPVEPKRGEASTTTILGLFSFGDAGVNAAAQQGGLSTVESADYRYFNILGIYQQYTTIVYGK